VDVLEVEVSFFDQPFVEWDGEHQHLVLVPWLDDERHGCLHFQLSHSCHHLEAHMMKMVD
jgi:hypothetical protein